MKNRFADIDKTLEERMDTNRIEAERSEANAGPDAAMLTAKEKKIADINSKEKARKKELKKKAPRMGI